MGKLAERIADPARSGVYRIELCEAVEEAAALNGFRLQRIAFGLEPAMPALEGQVIVLSGFEALLRDRPGELQTIVARLSETAARERARERCFFAAFLDPLTVMTALEPLYRWRKS